MKRHIFKAHIKKGMEKPVIEFIRDRETFLNQMIREQKIMTISIFRFHQTLFLYYESIEDNYIKPKDLIGETVESFLEILPGVMGQERYWVPMADIFHYNSPVSVEHWRRKTKPEKSVGRILQLKPETLSRYIYYHYQYQEEKPGDGDKYGIIGIYENLLFFYTEYPTYEEAAIQKGKLNTTHTPSNWSELMEEHFLSWEDVSEEERYWRYIETITYL
ncbi:hypothetical protein [Vallitalea guaymasensis]|uniref:Uncharacterized protein n=1 Tax=Vallitalea guaymasensis TaxID=1185412 RepID=A0A8J8ME92_9FIRM|nr:hypothetical protein [Vallitalea guaymasensis]QUH31337.1 hypothetical protein HYG85_21380 [Vallitalea guaymasensis]